MKISCLTKAVGVDTGITWLSREQPAPGQLLTQLLSFTTDTAQLSILEILSTSWDVILTWSPTEPHRVLTWYWSAFTGSLDVPCVFPGEPCKLLRRREMNLKLPFSLGWAVRLCVAYSLFMTPLIFCLNSPAGGWAPKWAPLWSNAAYIWSIHLQSPPGVCAQTLPLLLDPCNRGRNWTQPSCIPVQNFKP